MMNGIEKVTVTCRACGTAVSVEVPDFGRNRSRAEAISDGVKAVSCPICKCQYGFSLEEIVKDAVRLNGIAERLDFAASRHGVEYGRRDIDGSARDELI